MTTVRAQQSRPLRYGIFDSPLGKCLVATTVMGVCAVAFADDPDDLTTGLQRQFAGCTAHQDDAAMEPFADALLASMTRGRLLRLPVDVQGTAFQRRVWEALQAIPRGQTRTYGQVANLLGLRAASARAVAGACAANPIALAIPCHRVLGADGNLRGYRWGMERKRHLLQLEQLTPKWAVSAR